MEHEFINDRLAYFRISMKDRIWFFKHDGKVDAIAIPDGSHFTLSGHTDREVLSQMFERPFGKKVSFACSVRCPFCLSLLALSQTEYRFEVGI